MMCPIIYFDSVFNNMIDLDSVFDLDSVLQSSFVWFRQES